MKLLFDPDQDRPFFIPENIEVEKAKLPKDVTEVASDYMRVMFQHAIEEIESNTLNPEFLNSFTKQYVLTVPGVWSDKAKDMTLKAATMAGISPVELITEPEAGALYTLASMKRQGLQLDDAILICDAGGGTVDLISYEILSLKPFEVKALTKPSGGIAGSTMINKLLEEEIRKAVGDEAYIKLKETDGYRAALKEFDVAIKVSFEGKNDRDKFISFPMANLKDNPRHGLVKNSMARSGATIFRLFDPIVREVDRLITEQVQNVKLQRLQATPSNPDGLKAIFLICGFGASGYLKEIIKKSNPNIMVIQPREAWSAIIRGAVMSKLPMAAAPSVVSTKASKHYGTCMSSKYDPIRDKGFPTYKGKWDEVTLCKVMSWFIFMNDELERGKKTKLGLHRYFPGHHPSGHDLIVKNQLYECTVSDAPDHPTSEGETLVDSSSPALEKASSKVRNYFD
ncbi:uncharacterized protein Z520_02794 [Fonsecaea multimorphosa CBS 102226]|uniref:Uncharacterized protein n=1 Tax=Fonsecaea multimorphosa CBS 102226 TaxID=1442371 RepID=A0A0D2IW10_9EURO|nr:uncharacterized protein Z520_02794 [Fonsecaea multimorphosa CBS 102226]KIY01242.1 hypothetical protein Z520_02794 [Fonsecaea multimorphosa CBS 102226]OAL28522.1 hypothetical protein AYO22_02716 [Fonsecaea multimorphosa]